MLERVLDMLAVELDIDPAEIRRRNFIPKDRFPFETASGATYDVGDYEAALDRALEMADYAKLRDAQKRRRDRGDRLQLGIGVSAYVEVTALARADWGSVEVDSDGQFTAMVGTSGHGQGHETAFAQIVAELFHVPLENVKVIEGDTKFIPRGSGTGGSRSLQIGGTVILQAGEGVIEKARRLFAHLSEAEVDDVVVFENGTVGVAGVPSSGMTWAELAAAADDPDRRPDDMDPGLVHTTDFEQERTSFPFGAHVCVVEVDIETGDAKVLRHIAVDDCGRILSRLLVDGQVHGGVAQGIGQALLEHVRYDEDANPLTANLVSYLIPAATNVPMFEVDHTQTPTPLNPLGAKGIGESGTIGSTPAVQNAIVDAVSHLGITNIDMPASPARIWSAIRAVG
jgi:carbon-monoxide dehydrogenase large subunit